MAIFNSYVSLPEGNPQLELPKWIPLVKDLWKKSSQSTAPFRPVTGALRHPDHLLPGPGPWNQTWGWTQWSAVYLPAVQLWVHGTSIWVVWLTFCLTHLKTFQKEWIEMFGFAPNKWGHLQIGTPTCPDWLFQRLSESRLEEILRSNGSGLSSKWTASFKHEPNMVSKSVPQVWVPKSTFHRSLAPDSSCRRRLPISIYICHGIELAHLQPCLPLLSSQLGISSPLRCLRQGDRDRAGSGKSFGSGAGANCRPTAGDAEHVHQTLGLEQRGTDASDLGWQGFSHETTANRPDSSGFAERFDLFPIKIHPWFGESTVCKHRWCIPVKPIKYQLNRIFDGLNFYFGG